MDFIELKDVYFEYEKDKPIIKNINLKINKDEITAIVGANGSGKTTLGKLIMGILKPAKGQVIICKKDICNMTLAEIGSKIGYLFQNPEKHFFCNTVEEELAFALRFNGYDVNYINGKVEELLTLFQLQDKRNDSPLFLSQGEKQRLAIATILINNPEYLILDEPTTGLDSYRKGILIDILKDLIKKGVGMTIISHDHFTIEELSHRRIGLKWGEIQYDERN